jgi:prepilin-type N-terminal cleavage/methylation domain-containing protein/prepilin-type processing-associated H-X9-DG protein
MKRKGFTLIELLVVITVISALMAILLPALSRARQQCRKAYCLNNLRQMVMAAQTYTEMNDGYYPIAYHRRRSDTKDFEYYWDFTKVKDRKTKKIEIAPGLLWQGQMIEKIQQCPSYAYESEPNDDPYTGYNYNTSYVGHGFFERVSPEYRGELKTISMGNRTLKIVMPIKIGEIRRPDRCILFGDGQYSDGTNKFMRAPESWDGDTDNSLKAAGTQGFRHAGATNIAWADGHISSQKDYFVETISAEKKKLEQHNNSASVKIGFISKDNSLYDLQ